MNDFSRPSFFLPGGALPMEAPSYIERRADIELTASLLRGEFCYVLTSRQMGKSSLMIRTAARLAESGMTVAILDLNGIGHEDHDSGKWYFSLLMQIGEQLDLEEELESFWQACNRPTPLQKWMAALRHLLLNHCPGSMTLFIDEIDQVRSLPFKTDDFFAAIRGWYNRRPVEPVYRRLTFCLLGVALPSDLIRDPRLTPFNIGRRIELTDFTREEMAALEPGLGREELLGEALLERVYHWTGGHPYLTQRLCQAIVEAPEIGAPEQVDALCCRLFLTAGAREQDDNLTCVRDRLRMSEEDVTALLTLYARIVERRRVPDSRGDALVDALRLSGVVRAVEGVLLVRNRIYEQVFDAAWARDNIPDAEQRRQRRAYRLGLLRAFSIAGVLIAMLTGLAVTAYWQSLAARKAEKKAVLLQQQAVQLQQAAYQERYVNGIAIAGNSWQENAIANMNDFLVGLRPQKGEKDLREFEWGYLWRLSHDERLTIPFPDKLCLALALTQDGKMLAMAGRGGTIRLWDVISHHEVGRLSGHTEKGYFVQSLTFTPDGRTLASCSTDGSVRVWDVPARCLKRVLKAASSPKRSRQEMKNVVFSPNGRFLAAAENDGTVWLWETSRYQVVTSWSNLSRQASAVAFSSDSRRLAAGGIQVSRMPGNLTHILVVWDLMTLKQVAVLKESIDCLAFSPTDPETLVSGDVGGNIVLWDLKAQKQIAHLHAHEGQVAALAFSRDGKRLASAGWDDAVMVWDVAQKHRLDRLNLLKGHTERVNAVVFTPDGRSLISAGGSEVKVWDPLRPQESQILTGRLTTNGFPPCTLLPEGVIMGVDSIRKGQIRRWSTRTGAEMSPLQTGMKSLVSLVASPDGKRAALVMNSPKYQTIEVWDMTTRSRIRTIPGRWKEIPSLSFSPDGRLLQAVCATSRPNDTINSVYLWDVQRQEESIPIQSEPIKIVSAFSPDGRFLVTNTENPGGIRLWSVATRREIGRFPQGHWNGIMALAFSPGGKMQMLASASWDRQICLWDVATRTLIATMRGHRGFIKCLAFSPDGKTLASGGEDKTILLWNLAAHREMLVLKGHNVVTYLAFTPENQLLVSGDDQGTVRLWRGASLGRTISP